MLTDETTIILAPIDQGVRNVGGRDGAAQGPERLLSALTERGHVPSGLQVARPRIGNTEATLEADLARLSSAVEAVLERDRVPLVFGGDHGTTYATVRGASRVLDDLGVAYLDVHFDMRPFDPVHTSGSSFRRLVDEGWIEPDRIRPVGIQEPKTAQARAKTGFDELETWANRRGIAWTGLEDAREEGLARVFDEIFQEGSWCFSFDTDALDQRWAPGVSAPGAGRFTIEEAKEAWHVAANRCNVFDVVEYAPRLDEDDQTLESLISLLTSAR